MADDRSTHGKALDLQMSRNRVVLVFSSPILRPLISSVRISVFLFAESALTPLKRLGEAIR